MEKQQMGSWLARFASSIWLANVTLPGAGSRERLRRTPFQWLLREVRLFAKIAGRDIPTGALPGFVFTVAAYRHSDLSIATAIWPLLLSVGYFWLFLYVFCLLNQIHGEAEDRLNKPHRPLVSGEVDRPWMYRRLLVAAGALAAMAYVGGVALWACTWAALNLLYARGGWQRHWVTRNLFVALGLITEVAAGWQLVSALDPTVWRIIIVIALIMFIGITLQDLRDVDGDVAVHRRTAPLAFGRRTVRIAMAVAFLTLIPLLVHLLCAITFPDMPLYAAMEALFAVGSVILAARLLWFSHSKYQAHRTYMYFTYWFASLMATVILTF
ncbi:UbiA family prenyltransferase [Streptomyces collinus]|uniref:UbiA family prenyltransferase n=1 Tax=Streptomyces collinus TaxID=42684 RepID=UPI0033D18D62